MAEVAGIALFGMGASKSVSFESCNEGTRLGHKLPLAVLVAQSFEW